MADESTLITIPVEHERDVVIARRRAWEIAEQLGFDPQDRNRIATAVSEIARNAYNYAGGGAATFSLLTDPQHSALVITIIDRGSGIRNLDEIMAGRYQSLTGMGIGIIGARRLMDGFDINSTPKKGTTIRLLKRLPASARHLSREAVSQLVNHLGRISPDTEYEEFRRQNQDLMRALDELGRRNDEMGRLNKELEDTNRGVIALYAELDERAERLREADELKSRFLSHMSHEFRTPLNSIVALSRLLLDRTDGELNEEQVKQVEFIRRSALDLSELVNDLLDLAKVEAGRTDVTIAGFTVESLFGALRGVLRPLLSESASQQISLLFDMPHEEIELLSDEGKVAQILRNLISNALKFTERGAVRVSADSSPDDQWVTFVVSDSGIGIAAEDQPLIFQEFGQAKNRLQGTVKGTGLGLPLSRRLTELLGGSLLASSAPGVGSIFTVTIPRQHAETPESLRRSASDADSKAPPLHCLLIDDEASSRYVIRKLLPKESYNISETESGSNGIAWAQDNPPDIILLDLVMREMSGFEVLNRLRSIPATRNIPVIIITSKVLTAAEQQNLVEQQAQMISKEGLRADLLISNIFGVLAQAAERTRLYDPQMNNNG
jgi:signal transduction histidine kinase/CheY-like chemotaxis protein